MQISIVASYVVNIVRLSRIKLNVKVVDHNG